MLQLHGGGDNIFSPRLYRDFNARLGITAKARVLAVDYRQGPPWPASAEDAVTAISTCWSQAST